MSTRPLGWSSQVSSPLAALDPVRVRRGHAGRGGRGSANQNSCPTSRVDDLTGGVLRGPRARLLGGRRRRTPDGLLSGAYVVRDTSPSVPSAEAAADRVRRRLCRRRCDQARARPARGTGRLARGPPRPGGRGGVGAAPYARAVGDRGWRGSPGAGRRVRGETTRAKQALGGRTRCSSGPVGAPGRRQPALRTTVSDTSLARPVGSWTPGRHTP